MPTVRPFICSSLPVGLAEDVSAEDESPAGRTGWTIGPVTMEYQRAWEYQQQLFQARMRGQIPDVLLLVEHPHTYTIGRTGNENHLLIPEEWLRMRGINVYRIDRGGDITYHGPGQLVGYPILDLTQHRMDVHWYLRQLEEVIIRTLADYGIVGERIPNLTGVWVNGAKIAAIGVKVSRWISMHGFALNVNTELEYFQKIIPCGIAGKSVTAMAKELSVRLSLVEVARAMEQNFGEVFQLSIICPSGDKLPVLI